MSWSMARADALGLELPELEGVTVSIERIERVSCVHLLKSKPLPVRAKSCQLILGY
jgi:hypothetical protein